MANLLKSLAIVLGLGIATSAPNAQGQCPNCQPMVEVRAPFTHVLIAPRPMVPMQYQGTYRRFYHTPIRNFFFGRYRHVYVPQVQPQAQPTPQTPEVSQ